MKKTLFKNSNSFVKYAGLSLIGLFSFLYALFDKTFAERHISLPFLNFPIFVGEILLMVCFLLVGFDQLVIFNSSPKEIYHRRFFTRLKPKHYFIAGYFVWVVGRALLEYKVSNYSALTFRNAALFYYPFFIFFGYHFFSKQYFRQKLIIPLTFVLGVALVTKWAEDYYVLPVLALMFLLSLQIQNTIMRRIAFCFCGITATVLSRSLFDGSRSHLLAFFSAGVCFISYYFVFLNQMRSYYKVFCVTLLTLAIAAGIYSLADKNALVSIFTPSGTMRDFAIYNEKIKASEKDFKFAEIPVQIYNENGVDPFYEFGDRLKETFPIRAEKANLTKEQSASLEKRLEDSLEKYVTQAKIRALDRKKAAKNFVVDNAQPQTEGVRETVLTEVAKDTQNNENVIPEALTASVEKRAANNSVKINEELQVEDIPQIFPEKEDVLTPLKSGEKTDVLPETASKGENLEDQFMVQMDAFLEKEIIEVYTKIDQMSEGDKVKIKHEMKALIILHATGIQERPLSVAYVNILFRIFIWRDMFEELFQHKAIWGFPFSMPQRSKSLEILGWASSEWRRDGWITPHNSFFHILYRSGIVGVLLLSVFLVSFIRLIFDFGRKRSLVGGVLIGVMIYWIGLANFLIILEFPYHAIPFWSLFGVTLAYRKLLLTDTNSQSVKSRQESQCIDQCLENQQLETVM